MDLSPIGIVRIQGGASRTLQGIGNSISCGWQASEDMEKCQKKLAANSLFVKSIFDDSHSPFQSGEHACGRGPGKGNADKARNGLLGGISFQMMRFSSICTSAHYRWYQFFTLSTTIPPTPASSQRRTHAPIVNLISPQMKLSCSPTLLPTN